MDERIKRESDDRLCRLRSYATAALTGLISSDPMGCAASSSGHAKRAFELAVAMEEECDRIHSEIASSTDRTSSG